MFRMERKCVSRRFRKYNPRGVVVPTTAKQGPHVKPFDCAQGRRGAKYKGVDSRLRGNDNIVVPTTAKQETHVKLFDCAQARRGAKYKGVDSRLRGNDNIVVPTTAKQERRNNPRLRLSRASLRG